MNKKWIEYWFVGGIIFLTKLYGILCFEFCRIPKVVILQTFSRVLIYFPRHLLILWKSNYYFWRHLSCHHHEDSQLSPGLTLPEPNWVVTLHVILQNHSHWLNEILHDLQLFFVMYLFSICIVLSDTHDTQWSENLAIRDTNRTIGKGVKEKKKELLLLCYADFGFPCHLLTVGT